MKTQYEQFKEDVQKIQDESIAVSFEISDIEQTKQSYLNSIDCMIEYTSKLEDYYYGFMLRDLKEQRKLIEDHEA